VTSEELHGLELSDMVNLLRGARSFDDLSRAVDGAVGSATIQRLADRNRPFNTPVQVESLIGTARAINAATPNKVTPWVLWLGHGRQFARTKGLWGEPSDEAAMAANLLAPGWHRLTPARLAVLNRLSAALLAEQSLEEQASTPPQDEPQRRPSKR
jgi:hypothetical protein